MTVGGGETGAVVGAEREEGEEGISRGVTPAD